MIRFKIKIVPNSKKYLHDFMELIRELYAERKAFTFCLRPKITEKSADYRLYLQFQNESYSDCYVLIDKQDAAEISVLNYSIFTLSSNLEISFKGNYLYFEFSSSNVRYEPRIENINI